MLVDDRERGARRGRRLAADDERVARRVEGVRRGCRRVVVKHVNARHERLDRARAASHRDRAAEDHAYRPTVRS